MVTLTKQQKLMSFENKVLKNVMAVVYDTQNSRQRVQEIEISQKNITGQALATRKIGAIISEWVGHIVRVESKRIIKKIYIH